MKTYLVINGEETLATFDGLTKDQSWDGRESKTINCTMTYADANALFVDELAWSIKCVYEEGDVPEGEPIPEPEVFDNSDYSLAGDITDHRNGTISAKMGKLTELEETLEIIYGGVN